MKPNTKQAKEFLLSTAKAVAAKLKVDSKGTCIRIRVPHRTSEEITDGWAVIIGDLGKNGPRLSLWYDRFSGHTDRKLWAGFYSYDRKSITAITKRVHRKLWPVRVITLKDIGDEKNFCGLSKPLPRSEFNAPILEEYEKGETFFGIYDLTQASGKANQLFCDRAVAFFEDVARTLPLTQGADEHREVYPRIENRKRVASHLVRERSSFLSTERKILDNYECQACRMNFKDVYGIDLGEGFAEAHHIVPLSQLKGKVKTRLEDLRTVCANCHRMLHRMDSKADDILKLKSIVKRNR